MNRRAKVAGRKKEVATERFLMLPKSVLDCPGYFRLGPAAVKLLLDIGAQYNGRNNGDLQASWKLMKPRGWRSETTLNNAKKELISGGFVQEMRKGRRPNVCSLFALTWRPLDPSPKHDFGPNGFESRAYLLRVRETESRDLPNAPCRKRRAFVER